MKGRICTSMCCMGTADLLHDDQIDCLVYSVIEEIQYKEAKFAV